MIRSILWEDQCVECSGEKRHYRLGGDKTLCDMAPAHPLLQRSLHRNPPSYKPVIPSSAVLQPNQALPALHLVFIASEAHFSAPSLGLHWRRAISPARSNPRSFAENKSKSTSTKLVFRTKECVYKPNKEHKLYTVCLVKLPANWMGKKIYYFEH